MQWRRRLTAMMRKELYVLLRDRFYLFMALLLPLLTLILMGYGMTSDVKNLPLGVVDADQSRESRTLIDALTASGYFRLAVWEQRPEALEDAMRLNRIRAAVVIPSGFSRRLLRGQRAPAQVLIDASLPSRAEITRGYADAIIAQFNHQRLRALAARAPGLDTGIPAVTVISRIWYNPTLESRNFIVTGLFVISLLFWSPMLVSLSVTREKESGAILNIQTVPLARWEYIVGKLVPYTAIIFTSYFLLLLGTVVLFRIPLRGSLGVLTTGAFLYVVAMTGLGLLVSVLVRTQIAALLVTATLVMSIGLFYSGWLQPISSLDAAGQLLGRTLPTADFMTLSRGVFLKGLGWEAYGRTLIALGVYASVVVLLAILGFRKRRR